MKKIRANPKNIKFVCSDLDHPEDLAIDELNSFKGGLAIMASINDPVPVMPIENIEAICRAFSKYCF
jgi:hypothetical protein